MRAFFDTNILVRAFDSSSPQKQSRALDELLAEALRHGQSIEGMRTVNPFVETSAG